MRFGIFFLPDGSREGDGLVFEEMLRLVVAADSGGWNNIWFAEHHFHPYGGVIPSAAIAAAAAATVTENVRIGGAVSVLPLTNPVRVAEDFAMVDQLSRGRLDMGIGRGFMPHEFEGFGIPMEERDGRFREALDILEASWTEPRVSYRGNHFQVPNIAVYPRPYQNPPPIWMAASTNPESFRLAGMRGYGLMVNPYTRTQEEFERGLGWYRSAAKDAGRDLSSLRILANRHLYVATTEEAAREDPREPLLRYLAAVNRAFASGREAKPITPTTYEEMYPKKVAFGTPADVRRQLAGFRDSGITDMCFTVDFGGMPIENVLASMRLFEREVMPAFQLEAQPPAA